MDRFPLTPFCYKENRACSSLFRPFPAIHGSKIMKNSLVVHARLHIIVILSIFSLFNLEIVIFIKYCHQIKWKEKVIWLSQMGNIKIPSFFIYWFAKAIPRTFNWYFICIKRRLDRNERRRRKNCWKVWNAIIVCPRKCSIWTLWNTNYQ